MKWKKKGLIFKNEGLGGWRDNSALQPTPLILEDKIRFYVGFRDVGGTSRIGYIDVNKEDPQQIIHISDEPVLDIGRQGAFDEFGVVPSAVIKVGDKIHMYYAGYQLGINVRFQVLSGLAISEDNGKSFKRYSEVPVFERTNQELLFRVPHSVIRDEGMFRFWYGGGSHFTVGKEKTLPIYDIRYLESHDGINIPNTGTTCIETNEDEYRLGRPYVVKGRNGYHMFYGYSTEEKHYQLGYATSTDGKIWARKDNELGVGLSRSGWDSEMMAYPSIVQTQKSTFMFYNGNSYGHEGFGYAVLDGRL